MPNDFISRATVLSDIEQTIENSGCVNHEREIIDCVRYADAADVAPVVHARWIETPKDGWTRMECSGCGHSYYVPANINPIEWADDRNYCVKCGSRMDGGESHAD